MDYVFLDYFNTWGDIWEIWKEYSQEKSHVEVQIYIHKNGTKVDFNNKEIQLSPNIIDTTYDNVRFMNKETF